MSIWGHEPSQNDDAADWLSELEEEPSLDFLEEAFADVVNAPDTGYLEIPECCIAVAAAEVLAEVFGMPGNKLLLEQASSAALKSGLNHMGVHKNQVLVARALAAVEFILNDQENSELRQVWNEDQEDVGTWAANMKQLEARLTTIAAQLQVEISSSPPDSAPREGGV